MKRIVAIVLLGVVLVTTALVVAAAASDHRSMAECYDTWEDCRREALNRDASFLQTWLMLTVCDIALGRCILYG